MQKPPPSRTSNNAKCKQKRLRKCGERGIKLALIEKPTEDFFFLLCMEGVSRVREAVYNASENRK